MARSITSKTIKTLRRRLTYLTGLPDSEKNSYDHAEIVALRTAIKVSEFINAFECQADVPFYDVLMEYLDDDVDDDDDVDGDDEDGTD